MRFSPILHRRLAPLLLVLGAIVSSTAQAKDLSLPYRNYPGFVCHHTNALGECVDYSYFEYGAQVSPYSSYPAYNVPYSNDYYNANAYPYSNNYNANLLPCGNSYGGYASNCYAPVNVRVSSTPRDLVPGTRVTYRIYVRNDDSVPRNVAVRATLDSLTSFLSASNGGMLTSSNMVNWSLSFGPRASRILLVTAIVSPNARNGDTIRLVADVNGSQDETVSTVRYGNNYPYSNNYDANLNYNSSSCYQQNGAYNCNGNYPCYYNGSTYSCSNNSNGFNNNYGNVTQCSNGSSSCNLSLTLTQASNSVSRSQLITYTVTLRNNDSVLHTVDLYGSFEANAAFSTASDTGYQINGNQIRWLAYAVGANTSRTVTITGRVNSDARSGDLVRFSALASGLQQTITATIY